jgi:hypothetical protein
MSELQPLTCVSQIGCMPQEPANATDSNMELFPGRQDSSCRVAGIVRVCGCRRTRGRSGFRQESRRPDQAGSTRSKHSVPKRERHRPVAPSAAECPTIGPTYNGGGSDRLSITAGCRRRTRVVGVRRRNYASEPPKMVQDRGPSSSVLSVPRRQCSARILTAAQA